MKITTKDIHKMFNMYVILIDKKKTTCQSTKFVYILKILIVVLFLFLIKVVKGVESERQGNISEERG